MRRGGLFTLSSKTVRVTSINWSMRKGLYKTLLGCMPAWRALTIECPGSYPNAVINTIGTGSINVPKRFIN